MSITMGPFLDIKYAESLLPIAPFWYFRELRTSLITRSFVLLCIPCWLSATRVRSICFFFFCLLRLMYWYRRPQRCRWYFSVVTVSLRSVNSAFASATALVDGKRLYSAFCIATHSVCFLVGLVVASMVCPHCASFASLSEGRAAYIRPRTFDCRFFFVP